MFRGSRNLPRAAHAVRAAGRRRVLALSWLPLAPLVAAGAACPVELVGTWKSSDAAAIAPRVISFTPDGWANVLNGPGEQDPLDLVAQVRYQAQPPHDPRRIDFEARRGNDVFPAGTTRWEITAHTDDAFTTRRRDDTSGTQVVWSRVPTHRYFLTFAGRRDTATGETAAFVMWTTLDGQKPQYAALGAVSESGGANARFGRIPPALAREFATQGNAARDVMMRLELSEAEYLRTHAVYRASVAARGGLQQSQETPNERAMKLIERTVESLNRCGLRIQPAQALAVANGVDVDLRRSLELVRAIRRTNDRRHLPDKAFPFSWKPPEVI
jgi:hypothetical protein